MSRTGTKTHGRSAQTECQRASTWRGLLAFIGTVACCAPSLISQTPKTPTVAPNVGNLPMSFTQNQGQSDKSVTFLARGQGYGLYLTGNEAVLALRKPASPAGKANLQEVERGRMLRPFLNAAQRRRIARALGRSNGTDTLRMELKGANAQAKATGADQLPGTTNYFLGKDPTQWRTHMPTFAKVRYTGVYPGVDLIYYGNQRRLEYDFVVAAHASPKQVKLRFSGAQQLVLDDRGNLLVIADNGEVAFQKPVVYQDVNGQRIPIEGRYALLADHTVGFKVGKYDHGKALVIDPTLSYSTYLGGSTEDAAIAIAVDAAGSIYVTGFTIDTDFPVTPGALQTTNPVENEIAFVSKLNAAGSALVYSTYLGGTATSKFANDSETTGIAVDAAGNAYVCGETDSNTFPVTAGAFQTTNKGFANNAENTFVSKLNPTGTALVYSTYLGGSGLDVDADFFEGDTPLRMAIDKAGSAYVVGSAYSTDFPTTQGAYQVTNKAAANIAPNAYVTKLNPTGTALAYSTYLGGTGISPGQDGEDDDEGDADHAYGVAVDAAGEAYVSGYTFSTNFPVTANGYQQVNHAAANFAVNAFASRLNATGTALLDSTYLGGTGLPTSNSDLEDSRGDEAVGVALDTSGNAYLTGVAASTDFPTTAGAYQKTNKAAANGVGNVFVSKLDPTLTTLIYSTYVGGSGIPTTDSGVTSGGDFATGIAIDTLGDAYITGATESRDFPVTTDAYQAGPGSAQSVDSGFFTELNPAATGLLYSTYLGGSGASSYGGTDFAFFEGDFFYDLVLDQSDNAYLTGYAYSYDFPVTKNAFQRVNNAGGAPGGNTFITKFGATAGTTYLPTSTTLSSVTTGTSVTFTALVKPITGAGVPTGSINFYVDAVKETTVALDATGTATYTNDQLSANLSNVIAAYSGDATYGASGSSLGQNPPAPPDVATSLIFTTPPTALIGQGANGGTAVVTVVDASGNPITTAAVPVSITINGPAGYTPQTYPAVTTAGGIATFNFGNYPLTIAGTYSYTASSQGLVSATALESVAPVIASISPTTVIVGSSASTVTLNGNFTGFVGSDAYYVCFKTAAPATFPSPISGMATAITAAVPAQLLATVQGLQVYVGDPKCATQYSNVVPLAVINPPAQTSAVLTAAPATVAYGKPVTLTATLTSAAGAPITPGLVFFCYALVENCNSLTSLGSAQLNAAGVASLSLYPGAVGTKNYEAAFLGTTAATSAYSGGASVTVTGAYPTITSLSEEGGVGNYTLTSTVVGQGTSTLTPGGPVSFIDQTNAGAILGTAALVTGVAAQTLAAANGSPVAVGAAPYSVATGDFNGDGLADFAVENYGDGTVSVLLGNGDGTFKPQVTYAVGTEPEGIVAADVNGDGKLDLVVTNTGSASISVLLGNGDGTFQAQLVNNVDLSVAGVVVADFNNDGKPDIATSNFYSADVTILLGNGDGTFQQEQTFPAGNEPRTLNTGDFNGDGIIDLAVANQEDNTLSILIGNGDGTFQQQVVYPTGTAPQGIAVADFNNDGLADLVIGNSGDGTVGILLGNGNGTFKAMTTYAAGAGALGPVVADFNGDGNADVAVENFNGATESLLLGNGDGTLGAQATFATGTSPYAAIIGDFNGDGSPDIAISNFGTNNETILLDQTTSTATATLSGVAVTGTAGNHNVVATYPGDTNFTTSTSTPVILVAPQPATPTVTSISPSSATVGSASTVVTIVGTQFVSGSAVTVNGAKQAATFTSATQLTTTLTAAELSAIGTLTLAVVNPDGIASNTVVFTVSALPGVVLKSISPVGVTAGAGNTTITVSGANFTATSVVNFNAAPLATTFVSATQVTAVAPAALLVTAATASITVTDTASGSTSAAAVFTIVPTGLAVTFTGPTTSNPGEQPPLTFTLQQPYPLGLAGTMTLAFAPDPGNPANPQIQFATGGTTLNFNLPANSTATPAVDVQVGTVSGTITVTLQLTATGVNVTPATVAPITIVVPKVAPTITNLSFTASGNTLTVLVTGYSTTREIQSATFNFTPASGQSLTQKTITVPGSSLFQTWYSNTDSAQFGSEFTYTQLFTLSGNASEVGAIGATLTNSIGTSTEATAP